MIDISEVKPGDWVYNEDLNMLGKVSRICGEGDSARVLCTPYGGGLLIAWAADSLTLTADPYAPRWTVKEIKKRKNRASVYFSFRT